MTKIIYVQFGANWSVCDFESTVWRPWGFGSCHSVTPTPSSQQSLSRAGCVSPCSVPSDTSWHFWGRVQKSHLAAKYVTSCVGRATVMSPNDHVTVLRAAWLVMTYIYTAVSLCEEFISPWIFHDKIVRCWGLVTTTFCCSTKLLITFDLQSLDTILTDLDSASQKLWGVCRNTNCVNETKWLTSCGVWTSVMYTRDFFVALEKLRVSWA